MVVARKAAGERQLVDSIAARPALADVARALDEIAEKTVARADLERLVARALPYLKKLERFSRPRLEIVTDTYGKILIGMALLLLGFIMILPIPFVGNIPPGVAATIIAVGLIERDGVVVLAGLAASIVAVAVASAATGAAILWLVNLFTG
jgi:hypothetical protein